MNEDKIQ